VNVQVPETNTEFRHEAVFYDGDDDFASSMAAFLRDGVARGEPALVVVSAAKIGRLREELGDGAAGVRFADMAEVGRNPARIIPAWHEFVAAHKGPGVRLRGIGEPIFPERTEDELVECQRHESLLNLAFPDAEAFWLVCPYNMRTLPDPVLDEARRSHPYLGGNGHTHESELYQGLDAIAAPFTRPLPGPPPDAVELVLAVDGLGAMRHLVGEAAARFGLDSDRGFDVVLAVNEVATNSLEHGDGTASLRVWGGDGTVVCEIRDEGRFADQLAGRRAPASDDPRGRGLWIANQLCDLVQIRSTAAGTSVRLHVRSR
jgi:anti-sigma regulatory factor (Ser/Thr protein kinase)